MDEKQFLEWKDKYWNLYYAEIEEEEFLFRELSRSEYKKGIRLYSEDALALEEFICSTCVLEPQDYDFEGCIAGIPTSLAEFILYESGFTEDTGKLNEYMNKYESEMKTLDNQIACIIKEAFNDLSIEQIEGWPMEKTVWYYSRAKYILETLRGIELTIEAVDTTSSNATKGEAAAPKQMEATNTQSSERKFEYDIGEGGSMADFSELAEIEAFMKGKWIPPERPEGEELI